MQGLPVLSLPEPELVDGEVERNLALLRTPLGEPWSGRARYAAAAFFYNRGVLPAEALEAYRILSRLDAEDPAGLLRQLGFVAAWAAPRRPDEDGRP